VLFDRRGSHVTLTAIGLELSEITDPISTLEEEVDELLSAQYDLIKGALTIATGSPQVTMKLVSACQSRYLCRSITVFRYH
jgi:DNA-binding transcriptional LysR family regulator